MQVREFNYYTQSAKIITCTSINESEIIFMSEVPFQCKVNLTI